MEARLERIEGFLDGTFRISFLTRLKPHLDDFAGKVVEVSVREKKARRGLDANAYYWTLLSQLADKLQTSKPALHNIMIGRYGQLFTIDGRPAYAVLPETEETAKKVEESTTLHLRPTSELKQGRDGRQWRTYMMMRGSHEYDTKEMSILIDGLVSECKDQGIETLTPRELAQMYRRMEEKNK